MKGLILTIEFKSSVGRGAANKKVDVLTAKAALHNQKSLGFSPKSKINAIADETFFEDIGRYKAAKGKSKKSSKNS